MAQNHLLQFVKLHETDGNVFQFKGTLYQNQSLQMFCSGLLEPYRSHLMNFNLTTLDEALNKCKTYDNKLQENTYTDYMRRLQDNGSSRPIPQPSRAISNVQSKFQSNFQSNFQPNFHRQFQSNSQNNFQPKHQGTFQHNLQRTNFSSQERPQYQPKPFSGDINKPVGQTTKFPSGKQLFHNKPDPTQQRNRYQPTPMSVQTSAFTFKPKPNYTQAANKPTFISEELYNAEVMNECHDYTAEEYYDEGNTYENECENNEYKNQYENFQETENFQLPASENQQR